MAIVDKARSPRRSDRRRQPHKRVSSLVPYLYILPFFVLFAAFGLFPMLATAYVSLTDWSLLDVGPGHWIGADNYQRLLHDPYMWNAARNTISLFVLSTVPQLCLALVIAQLLDWTIRARTLLSMGILLPYFTSVAAVTIVFSVLFSRDFGLVNHALHLVGIGPVDWPAGRLTSHFTVAAMVNWRWTGFNAIIYFAAIQTIPRDLYEAAAIDGAGRWRQFRHVTVPMLRLAIVFTSVLSTIGNIQLFTEPLLFSTTQGTTTGGSGRQFQTLALYMYEEGFRSFDFGYASAIAWTLVLLTAVAALLSYVLGRRIRAED
ncbi:sugar ABC transporter permease [Streptomyces sp. NPDC094149]|uniref:carbohydrate ABC transporter permease n=1 Tax=Streptomyces sp. NPDC094149 TaxID=3155079 RepID=UPI0033267058